MDIKYLLKLYYGYDFLKEEQNKIIESILNKSDTLGILPTGYGKSITFQLPALMLDGITIVITPLIALMQDQVANLKKRKIAAEYINSLQSYTEQNIIYNKLKYNRIKILYVSGERLQSQRFLKEISKIKISLLVCDEAHTLLWSEDFRKALGKIPDFIKIIGYRMPILALTATATSQTIDKIKDIIKLNSPNIISANCDRKNIFYRVVRSDNKLNDLLKYVMKYKNNKGLIYCLTIKNTKYVYQYLLNMGFRVGIYHGSLDADIKANVLNDFTLGNIDIIVCTNAFGMGIDIPDIRYVIEYDIPLSIEDLAQQLGRVSRDGREAEAIILFNVNDIKSGNYFIESIKNDEKSYKEIEEIKRDRFKKFDKVIALCLTKECLHKYICKYFNQRHNGKCMMCNNCKK